MGLPSRSRRGDPRSKTEVFQFQKPSDFSLFLAVSRLNWEHKKRCWGGLQSPVLRVAPAERSPSQWEAARHISTTPSPTTPFFPRPPRTSREASSLSSSLGKSREGREGAQAICGTQKVAQQQDRRSSGPGNWLKGSFLRHILLSAGLAQDRQEDKQTIRKVLIRRLSFSHFPTVSDLETPDQGKLRSIRAQCRSIYQDDEACLAIGLVDTHMQCTVHTTTQATQTQSKEEQQIKCICCNRFKH